MQKTRLAIVEDDPEVLAMLADYMGRQTEFDCVMQANSAEDFFAQLPDLLQAPQVLLLDVQMPGMSGIEALPHLKLRLPEVEVIMQTVCDDADRIYRALCAGASGYVLKSMPFPEMKAAVLEVMNGGAPMSRAVARKVLQHFKPTPSMRSDLLTGRERDVLQGIVDGLGDKQVAVRLGVSFETVRTHAKSIYRKLHVVGRGELMSRATRGEL